jgi:hypothetical protein
MHKPIPFFILFLCAAALQPALCESGLDPSSIVGMTLEQAYRTFGAPFEVYTLRGSEEWQDDVVFYYVDHVYLFWFENRVWQVRTDSRYEGSVFSLRMGESRQRVLEVMGRPLKKLEDSLVYHLEDRGYPIRVRFYFERDLLSDVYCFRGDL